MTPTLLALHGFAGGPFDLAPLAAELGPALPIEAPWLPGHGPAPEPVVPVELLSATLLDRVGSARPWLLGYSLGGRLALHLALARPQAFTGLVLVSTTAGLEDPAARAARAELDDARAADLEHRGVEAFLDDWFTQPLFAGLARLGPERLAAWRMERTRATAAGWAAALRTWSPGRLPALWHRLSELSMPALVACGAEDPAYVAHGRRLAQALPAATLTVIPGAGHALLHEAPRALACAITARAAAARAPGRTPPG